MQRSDSPEVSVRPITETNAITTTTITTVAAFLLLLFPVLLPLHVQPFYHLSEIVVNIIWAASWQKTTKWHVRPANTQISLGIRSVWSESSLSAWRKLGSLATHWAHSEDSDQTRRMPRLIWVFTGRTVILLVLSWGGSFIVKRIIEMSRECHSQKLQFTPDNRRKRKRTNINACRTR